MAIGGYNRLNAQEDGTINAQSTEGHESGKSTFSTIVGRARIRWVILGTLACSILILLGLFGSGSEHSPFYKAAEYYKSNLSYNQDGINVGPLSFFDPWVKSSGRKGLKYNTPFNPDDLTLTDDECDALFPQLYKEIDRSVDYFTHKQKYTIEYLEYACDDGIWTHARVVIYKNRVYLKSFQNNEEIRSKAALSLLHQAVTASRQKLPNVEFCIGLMDWGSRGKFGIDRAPDLEDVWLMPDPGFWSWPEHVGSYQDLRERTAKIEEEIGWNGKKDKLIWRGTLEKGKQDRESLVGSAQKYPWSDVAAIDWAQPDQRPIPMEDHCKWKYIAFPEGNTNNGRLRYLQTCHSVLVTHKPRWVQHWTHLYNPDWNSRDQNVVFVPPPSLSDKDTSKGIPVHDANGREIGRDRTWERLPETMHKLLRSDRTARKIADNQWKFFRERYSTPAAAMCYWRRAIRGFAKVQQYEVDLSGSETSMETFMLKGMREWWH